MCVAVAIVGGAPAADLAVTVAVAVVLCFIRTIRGGSPVCAGRGEMVMVAVVEAVVARLVSLLLLLSAVAVGGCCRSLLLLPLPYQKSHVR